MNVDVITLKKVFCMRYFGFLAIAFRGLALGLIGGLLWNGLRNYLATVSFGIFVAFLFCFFTLVNRMSKANKTAHLRRKPPPPRLESNGSFDQRMENYSANVSRTTEAQDPRPKQKFWVEDSSADYTRTPPKPISLIRMLLYRIRRIVSDR